MVVVDVGVARTCVRFASESHSLQILVSWGKQRRVPASVCVEGRSDTCTGLTRNPLEEVKCFMMV